MTLLETANIAVCNQLFEKEYKEYNTVTDNGKLNQNWERYIKGRFQSVFYIFQHYVKNDTDLKMYGYRFNLWVQKPQMVYSERLTLDAKSASYETEPIKLKSKFNKIIREIHKITKKYDTNTLQQTIVALHKMSLVNYPHKTIMENISEQNPYTQREIVMCLQELTNTPAFKKYQKDLPEYITYLKENAAEKSNEYLNLIKDLKRITETAEEQR